MDRRTFLDRAVVKPMKFGAAAGAVYALSGLAVPLGKVEAQDYDILCGLAAVTPTIDGAWSSAEWNDANQEQLTSYSTQGNAPGEVYVRLKHDDSRLHVLVDSVSDDGSSWTENGKSYSGNFIMGIDGNNDGKLTVTPPYDENDYGLILSTAGGKVTLADLYDKIFPSHANVVSQMQGASTIGTSPNSNVNHRIYELSVPLDPLIKNAPKTSDNQPIVGIEFYVVDPHHNVMSFRPANQPLKRMKISSTAVPEGIESVLPIALLAVFGFAAYFKRTNRDFKPHSPS